MAKFEKGHKGYKQKGTKHERTEQWEALRESIVNKHAEVFNERLEQLLLSGNLQQTIKGMEMYLQVLEYFKPKQSRVTHAGDAKEPVQIVIPKNV